MAKRRKKRAAEPKAETRKQARIRARDRERNRKVMMIVGAAIGLALLLVAFGVVNELLIKPNSALAKVEDRTIITRDFWKRARLRQSELENQLLQLQAFARQFGNQNIFASQIASINATLSSPLSLGTQVLNDMIEEQALRIEAPQMGVSVSDEEVDRALREEVARGQGAVTVPQATATAEAGQAATATAASFTPTPTPTVDASGAVTETADSATPAPTVEPPTPEPPTVLTDAQYQEGLKQLADNLKQQAGMSLDEYREVVRARLLRDKMQEAVGKEKVEPTEEQVHARHILIRFDANAAITDTTGITATTGITVSTDLTETVGITDTAGLTETAGLTDTAGISNADTRTEAQALALAQELRQRILDGEDFAALATEFSEDPGSAADGGDLGWAGRGRYVPEFEDAAFSLSIGEISEPVKTQFGYHLIEVLERDEARPKDENTLQQEYAQAFQAWLQEQILSLNVERPSDLPSKLPSGLGVQSNANAPVPLPQHQ